MNLVGINITVQGMTNFGAMCMVALSSATNLHILICRMDGQLSYMLQSEASVMWSQS